MWEMQKCLALFEFLSEQKLLISTELSRIALLLNQLFKKRPVLNHDVFFINK